MHDDIHITGAYIIIAHGGMHITRTFTRLMHGLEQAIKKTSTQTDTKPCRETDEIRPPVEWIASCTRPAWSRDELSRDVDVSRGTEDAERTLYYFEVFAAGGG